MKINKFKPFNLDAALAGAPAGSLLGGKAKILGYNHDAGDFPLAGWFIRPDGIITLEAWTKEGRYLLDRESESLDLYMLPVKVTREGWMNVYPLGTTGCNTVYPTKEDADLHASKDIRIYKDCIKIIYTYEE